VYRVTPCFIYAKINKPLGRNARLANIQKTVYWAGAVTFLLIISFWLSMALPSIIALPIGFIVVFVILAFSTVAPIGAVFVRPKFMYCIKLFASVFGTGLIIIFWANLFNSPLWLELISILAGALILIGLHIVTREGFFVHKEYLYNGLGLDIKKVVRITSVIVEPMLLFTAIVLSNPDLIKVFTLGSLTVFLVLIGGYIAFSIQGLNSTYRAKLIDDLLDKKPSLWLSNIKKVLTAKYPNDNNFVGLVLFLLKSSVDNFVFGDYEQSYADSYRVINDRFMLDNNVAFVEAKTVTLKHLSQKDFDVYRRIRTFLFHGYLQERSGGAKNGDKAISVDDIVETKRVLYKKAWELIELSLTVAGDL
jgi:hypothetical protein